MSSVSVKWHGHRVAKEIKADINVRLATVGALVTGEMKRRLSASSIAAGPSPPGSYPHAQTGRLRAAVTFETEPDKPAVRIIVPVEYAEFLEEGTSKMEARPFILRTVKDLRRQIKAIMTVPRKGLIAKAIGLVSDTIFGSGGDFTADHE